MAPGLSPTTAFSRRRIGRVTRGLIKEGFPESIVPRKCRRESEGFVRLRAEKPVGESDIYAAVLIYRFLAIVWVDMMGCYHSEPAKQYVDGRKKLEVQREDTRISNLQLRSPFYIRFCIGITPFIIDPLSSALTE